MHNAEKPNPPASVRDTGGLGDCWRRPRLEPETASARSPHRVREAGKFMGSGRELQQLDRLASFEAEFRDDPVELLGRVCCSKVVRNGRLDRQVGTPPRGDASERETLHTKAWSPWENGLLRRFNYSPIWTRFIKQ